MVASSRRVLGMTIPRSSTSARCSWSGALDADAGRHPRPRQLADVLRRRSSRCCTWRPAGSRSWSPGCRCSSAAPGSSRSTVGHVQDRVDIWLDPLDRTRRDRGLPDRAVAVRAGRRRAVRRGLRAGAARPARRRRRSCRRPDTDLIYAVIVNEVGLFGAAGVVLAYLLFAERGFRDRDAGGATASRSCWPPGSPRCSRSRCS